MITHSKDFFLFVVITHPVCNNVDYLRGCTGSKDIFLFVALCNNVDYKRDVLIAKFSSFAVIFSALGDYGYQMVTVGEVEAKSVKDTAVTTMIVSLHNILAIKDTDKPPNIGQILKRIASLQRVLFRGFTLHSCNIQ